MKKEKMYSVAIRRRANNKDHFWFHDDYEFVECKISTCGGRYWYADPFIYEKNDITYIFFEAYDLVKLRGKEGYCILLEDGSCTEPKIIIDESYHLSFPYIFDFNGAIYMMPEMCEDYSIKIYKSISFPDKWAIAEVILPDIFACDSVFVEKFGKRYLLTSEMFHNVPNGQYASCWVKNCLYEMEGLKVINHGMRIAEGDYGIRNAGMPFEHDGVLYRIGQDCRKRKYGKGLVLFKIDSLVPYKEEIQWGVTCEEIQSHIKREGNDNLLGVHTYNSSEHYEIIDFSEIRNVPICIMLKRYCTFIKRGIRKIHSKLLHS